MMILRFNDSKDFQQEIKERANELGLQRQAAYSYFLMENLFGINMSYSRLGRVERTVLNGVVKDHKREFLGELLLMINVPGLIKKIVYMLETAFLRKS